MGRRCNRCDDAMLSSSDCHNLIVFSDVHLGSDLVQHARPDAPGRRAASIRRDAELAALLDWYKERREQGRPWRLVIAGDFVDFVGMSITPPLAGIRTEPTDEERALGLGSAVDHTIYKLRQVAWHHHDVFRALAQFIEAGNTLVVVRGNHDVDFHWRPVQDEFLRQLALHARIDRGCVEFADWFYYEEGRVYVEHGHQYDSYCAHEHLLVPVLPRDPRRSARSLSDILLSYVVRPTRGMTEAGHDQASLLDYVKFALGLGIQGALGLARRFFQAVFTLIELWRDHFTESSRRIRELHDRRMADLASGMGISLEKLKSLASLQSAPVTRSLARILSTVLLDRVLLFLIGLLGAAVIFVLTERWDRALLGSIANIVFVVSVGLIWARARTAIEPSSVLRDRAARVATVFPAAFVVMGHTHLPEVRSATNGATYVNLGAWAEDDVPDGATPALPMSRTHLVVIEREDAPVAQLLVWDSAHGPKRFAVGYEPESEVLTRSSDA